MALDLGGSPNSTPTSASGVLSAGRTALYLLIIRLAGGLTMIYFQGWDQAIRASRHVWEKKPWELVTEMTDKGFPTPSVVASIFIFIVVTASFGIAVGFLTRINAFLMLLCTILILLTGLLDQFFIPQLLVVYAGIFLMLIFSGPGLVSFDALLTRRRQRKQSPNY